LAANDFGRVADIYDATRGLPEPEMGVLMEAMREQTGGRGPVIDVGVGTGRFALPLQRMGIDVVGIDTSRGMVAKAREKGVDGILFADVQNMPFRDASFESALLVHVLHLVGDWTRVVRESARVASSTVLSVIETAEGTDLRKEYRDLRTAMGYPVPRFEGGERALMGRVEPLRVVSVAEVQQEVSADAAIRHLREKGQSVTWDVPDEVHDRIIGRLLSSHAGETLRRRARIELVVWSAERLRTADLGPRASQDPALPQPGEEG